MTKRNAQDGIVSPDDERPQESAERRNAAETRGHGAKSAAVRERAILALLSENAIGAAAQRCGVNERTLRRWMADDRLWPACERGGSLRRDARPSLRVQDRRA